MVGEPARVPRIHEKARVALDERGAKLKAQLTTVLVEPRATGWRPDVYARSVPIGDIMDPQRSRTFGDAPQLADVALGVGRGLQGPEVSAFDDLCRNLSRAIRPTDLVGKRAVADAAMAWLFDPSAIPSFTEYCLSRLAADVRPYVVRVPITGLFVQQRCVVGEVTFEELSASVIQSWFSGPAYEALTATDKAQAHVDAALQRFMKEHRGHAVAIVTVVADSSHSVELGLAKADAGLGVLRFFCPASMVPELRSPCVLFGRERKEEYRAIVEFEGRMERISSGHVDDDPPRSWHLTTEEFAVIRPGLDQASALLAKESPTDFEKAVLSSILLYSDSTLEHRGHIRLLLVCSALEGILLANDTEPPSRSLIARLPVAAEPDPTLRPDLRRMLAQVYDLRSKFVHHGRACTIDELPAEFFELAWSGIVMALQNSDKVSRVAEFTGQLDELRRREEGAEP